MKRLIASLLVVGWVGLALAQTGPIYQQQTTLVGQGVASPVIIMPYGLKTWWRVAARPTAFATPICFFFSGTSTPATTPSAFFEVGAGAAAVSDSLPNQQTQQGIACVQPVATSSVTMDAIWRQ